MLLLDVTTKHRRLFIESRHINQLVGTENTTRYHSHFAAWQRS